jgi:dihydroneopterin aldolase
LNGRGSRLRLRDIRAHGRHGADPGERERPQPFNIDIELEVDLERARRSDQLADTVDYAAIHRRIVEIVGATSFTLLERLADEILADVMRDDRIAAATITIAKPGLLAGATPAVTIESRRAER